MYYQKSYNNLSRGSIKRTAKPNVNFPADDIWSAACAAQRINGDYVKSVSSYDTNDAVEGFAKETNRQVIERLLTDTSLITESDRMQAEAVRKYYKGLTFKILQGKKLSEFDNNAMVIANRDVIESNYDIAVIASLPSCYERAVKRDNINRKLEHATGGLIGKVGDKVKINIEVVRCTFSNQYMVHFVSGITDKDQAVFFSYKQPIDAGKLIVVQGTVKRHGENITQLNRAKVL